MGVNSWPKTVTRQRRNCNLNPGPSAPESSMLTTRLPLNGCVSVLFRLFHFHFIVMSFFNFLSSLLTRGHRML